MRVKVPGIQFQVLERAICKGNSLMAGSRGPRKIISQKNSTIICQWWRDSPPWALQTVKGCFGAPAFGVRFSYCAGCLSTSCGRFKGGGGFITFWRSLNFASYKRDKRRRYQSLYKAWGYSVAPANKMCKKQLKLL